MKHQSTFELGLMSRGGPEHNENQPFPRTRADELAAFADLNAAIDGKWQNQAHGGFEDRAAGIPSQAFLDKLELFPPTEAVRGNQPGKAH